MSIAATVPQAVIDQDIMMRATGRPSCGVRFFIRSPSTMGVSVDQEDAFNRVPT
jgi:hypothetical protein